MRCKDASHDVHRAPGEIMKKQLLLLRSPSMSPSLSRTKSNFQHTPLALGAIFDHDITKYLQVRRARSYTPIHQNATRSHIDDLHTSARTYR
jgi:hypothetical protein